MLRDLVRSFVRASRLLDEQQTACGLPVSPREAHALAALRAVEAEPRALGQTQLAFALGIDKSNVTRLVQRMVDAGYIAQDPDDDGRKRFVRLSVKGRRLADRIEAASIVRFADVLAAIPAPEVGRVLAALHVLNTALARVEASDGEG